MVTHRLHKSTPRGPRPTAPLFSQDPATLTTEEIIREIRRLRAASKNMYRQLVERAHAELAAEEAC